MNFITGGCGFIASHLVERIGGKVYDNLSVINAQLPEKDFTQADLLDPDVLRLSMEGCDTVWHLAASSDIAIGNKITDTDLKNNTIGTYNVLEAMKVNGIKKIVFSSSATVYGDCDYVVSEEDPFKPNSLYGASKVACEALINAYSNLFGIQAWIFRFGNVIGGRMGHGVLYDFIKKLRANPKELEIIGDGTQERPFFLVEDCIDGMLCGLNYPPNVYNLAPTTRTTINTVARIVIDEMKLSGVNITHAPCNVWDVKEVQLDTWKIHELGWYPKHTSDEAVRIAVRRLLEE